MPRHDTLSDLNKSLNEQPNKPNKKCKYMEINFCIPLGICGLFISLGLLCGYLIHESYQIEDGSI